MDFSNVIWADSNLEKIIVEYDRVVLEIWSDILQSRLLIKCSGLAGITDLCIWDDTIISEAQVRNISSPINSFTEKLFSIYEKDENYGGRSLNEGLLELQISLVNNTTFCIYCLKIDFEDIGKLGDNSVVPSQIDRDVLTSANE